MIWWLASYPKSGNTWLRMFLSGYLTGSVDINRPAIGVDDLQRYFYQAVFRPGARTCAGSGTSYPFSTMPAWQRRPTQGSRALDRRPAMPCRQMGAG